MGSKAVIQKRFKTLVRKVTKMNKKNSKGTQRINVSVNTHKGTRLELKHNVRNSAIERLLSELENHNTQFLIFIALQTLNNMVAIILMRN